MHYIYSSGQTTIHRARQTYMEMENTEVNKESRPMMMSKGLKRLLLFLNITMLFLGESGAPLLMRLYFLDGGKRIWFWGWLSTCGWPAMLVPLLISYLHRRRNGDGNAKLFSMKPDVFAACSFIGLLIGLVNYLYASGMSRLPVSTSALIFTTQIAFTALFSFILVKQRLTAYSINSIVLLVIGAVVLGVHAGGDRPANETNKQYYLGFLMMISTSLLYGIMLPLIELVQKRAKKTLTYSLAMEMQMVMSFSATAFSTIGMVINNDFKVIQREAREFKLGPEIYCTVVASYAIFCQFCFFGASGVIFYGSSLLAGIVVATVLSVTETLAVVLYHEKFKVEKGISLALCLWGFTSYFYGELKQSKKTAESSGQPSVTI